VISQPMNVEKNSDVLMIRFRIVPKRPRHVAGVDQLTADMHVGK